MGTFKKDSIIFGTRRWIPTQYEPMRQYRCLLTIPNPSNGQIGQFFVRIDSPPALMYGGFDVHTLARTRTEWHPITIKIMDTVGPTAPEFFRDWMVSHTETITTGRMGYGGNYKRNIQLERLDPTGVVIEKWVLTGAQIQEMRHEIVYDQTVGDIEIRIIFDNATLHY